jgi:hypothetical protein
MIQILPRTRQEAHWFAAARYSAITDGLDTGPASGRSSMAIMEMAAMASMTVAAPKT